MTALTSAAQPVQVGVETQPNVAFRESAAVEFVSACELCASDAFDPLFATSDRLHKVAGVFRLVRCTNCGLVRLSHRPSREALASYYPADSYYSYQVPAASVETISSRPVVGWLREGIRRSVLHSLEYPVQLRWWEKGLQPLATRFLAGRALYGFKDQFPGFRANGAALDVGCGNGSYLSYLKRHGWNVAGVEFSERAARKAKEAFGIDVFVGELEEAPFQPASFHFIRLSHVLEHVPHPLVTLSSVAELLDNGGSAYIETPNAISWATAPCRQFWFPWDSPRHLWLLTPETLRRVAERSGLKVTKLWTSLQPNLFCWEDTYRVEEASGQLAKHRPRLRASRVPRALGLRSLQHLQLKLKPNSGDIIHCCLEKAQA